MWCFEIPVILLLVVHTSLCASQVTLELCEAPIKDEPCVLQCITPDLTQSVVFEKDNTEYASCKYILGTLSCTSIYPTRYLISQQSSPTVVTLLNITQLSRADDEGSWTCDYGSTGSTAHDLTVLTVPIHISTSGDVNLDYCTGDTRATYDVTLTVTCSSAVSVSAELSSPTGSTHIESLTVTRGTACVDGAESRYTAVFNITSTTGGLTGDDYTLTFKTKLSAGVGEVFDNVFASNITFSCDSTDSTPCTCIVTIVLGFGLSVIFTPLFIIVTWAVLAKYLKIDVVKDFVGANVKCILTIVVCTLLSCTFGGLFTLVAINRHDKDKRKGSKSESREEPEGKEEEKPVISRLAFQSERTPPREQQMGYNNKTKIKQRTRKVSPKKTNNDQNRRMCSILCEVCRPDDYYTIPENHLGIEVCSALCEVCMSKFENHSAIFENVTETRNKQTPRDLPPIPKRDESLLRTMQTKLAPIKQQNGVH